MPLPSARKPIRLWPGVVAATFLVLVRFVIPEVWPDIGPYGVLGALAAAVAIVLWWLFFSRAPWLDRIGALLLIAIAGVVTWLLAHPSLVGGMMGMMLPLYAIPITFGPIFVLAAVASRRMPDKWRRATMSAAIFAACGVWLLLRTDGVSGESGAQLAWRWTPTAEQQLLTRGEEPALIETPAAGASKSLDVAKSQDAAKPVEVAKPAAVPTAPATASAAKPAPEADAPRAAAPRIRWPGFRGPNRDGVIPDVRIETDWSSSPPKELWRRPIGPGWSSFAVRGDLAYTQEQRGGDELVSAYRLSTGKPVWRHRDSTRFYESNGGPGPRGTPAVHDGRVYAMGATAIINALDADTGAVIWSRNASADTGATIPGWGFTGSPLVVRDLVIVSTSGRLVAYDSESGKPRWTQKTNGGGYSSPHLATLDGVEQIVMLSGGGATGVSLDDGAVLWKHAWVDAVNIVQPAIAEGDLLVAAGDAMGGLGIRRLSLSHAGQQWTAQERWTTRGLKPYFNDFVVHKGHAYGFDGNILSSIDLQSGERAWKGGRYGAGQLLLLPDQDLMLVVSEDGELVLVQAVPDAHHEIARFKAIEGKTWNHPVLVGDTLLVRNGEEMAAFRLSVTRE
jgi:outer membrane protein assembly factor BamB